MEDVRLCMVCDEPIPIKRLEAKPDAETCVNCQGELETRRVTVRSVRFRSTDIQVHPEADWASIRTVEIIGEETDEC